MSRAAFVVAGRFDARSGGSIYDRRVVEALRDRGWTIDVHEVHDGNPSTAFAAIPDGLIVMVDGLAFGAAPDAVAAAAPRLRLVPIVHLPLGHEVGLDPAAARVLADSERRAMGNAAFVVVTGVATARVMAEYGVPADRIAVIHPGTDPAPIAPGSPGVMDGLQLLCVATVSPGKGHEILCGALAAHRDRQWALTCVGNTERYPGTVERLRAAIRLAGLEHRITLAGELDSAQLDGWYARSDVFVLATKNETYGMAVAEALARGIPVVSTATGEIPALIGAEAGLLAAPGDARGFETAVSAVLADAELRTRLRAGALRARGRLQGWDQAAGRMADVLQRVAT